MSVVGRRGPRIVAIPEPARAIALAALAETSDRRPIVVAVPTSADAERLAHDLAMFVGEHHVDVFPAWETLPFERVSPSVETMGSRLRTLWHLREGGERSDKLFIVAPARALVQRLGPGAGDIDPIVVGPGDQLDSIALVERLGGIGYRREYQVEHRGEFAVRGSIIDVFPSTADAPVRIDFWGDEVDRLSEFAIDDQRSTIADQRSAHLPLPRVASRRRSARTRRRVDRQGALGTRAMGASGQRRTVRRHGVLAALARRRRRGALRPRRRGRARSCSSSRSGCVTAPPTSSTKKPISPPHSLALGMSK